MSNNFYFFQSIEMKGNFNKTTFHDLNPNSLVQQNIKRQENIGS